jgi:hypothetical protein
MLFSSIGREGIGLKDTLARVRCRGKSKKFMEAIRGLILQEADSKNADRQEKALAAQLNRDSLRNRRKKLSQCLLRILLKSLFFIGLTRCSLAEIHKKSLKLLKQ